MEHENYIKQLNAILEIHKMPQEKLAKEIGVTHAAFSRWLNGHAKPHKNKLDQINQLYKKLVYYPSFDKKLLSEIVKKAEQFKNQNIVDLIFNNQALLEDLLLEQTYNSSAIEGTTFTKRETEAIIFNNIVIKDKSLKEHLEITNHAAILKNIFLKKYDHKITEDLIKEMHKGLMHGLREDGGEYAKHHRGIRGLDIILTHPKDIAEEMSNLIQTWNKKRKKSIIDIADFHQAFELIHPFGDGNGRIGRLIMAIQCMQLGYPPVIIENIRKFEYYDVLEYAQLTAIGPFVEFTLNEIQKTSRIISKYL